jgi:hypothetical protein
VHRQEAAVSGTLWTVLPCVDLEQVRTRNKEISMLYTIAAILLILWLLGVVGTYTVGAFVHVLLVVAVVLLLVGLLSGRRVL